VARPRLLRVWSATGSSGLGGSWPGEGLYSLVYTGCARVPGLLLQGLNTRVYISRVARGVRPPAERKPCSARTVAVAGEWGGIRGRGAGARGGTAVPMCGCASRGVRKTLGGSIFLTGSPSCLDPDWCPGRAGCCSGVRAGAGGGWGLPGVLSRRWACLCSCACARGGGRGVLGRRWALGLFLRVAFPLFSCPRP
jgi:hypothetical protein